MNSYRNKNSDDDYEPPQWYKQQQRKSEVKEPTKPTGDRKPDIIIAEEFDRDSQIDIAEFQTFFNMFPYMRVGTHFIFRSEFLKTKNDRNF